jgi:UDP-2,4-diacetamido-2,4,6-trideoxy-beta-L-altropyranose hydrolase
MKVFFRVDSSLEIGAGHIMRCLVLAEELRKRGGCITFLSRELPGNLIAKVKKHGFEVVFLPKKNHEPLEINQEEDASHSLKILKGQNYITDWVVVDHYSLDAQWEKIVSYGTKRIMVIDDLANRFHSCDALLDMTLKRSSLDYISHLQTNCAQMLGSDYTLLRPQFREMRSESILKRNSNQPVKKLLICLGGVDNEKVTFRLLKIFETIQLPVSIDVVLLSTAPHLEQVQAQAKKLTIPTRVHIDLVEMGKVIVEADWGIVAGGMTSFECCCLGLPTFIINTAENQVPISQTLKEINAAHLLGYHNLISDNYIAEELIRVMQDEKRRNAISLSASKVCDGKGTERVVDRMVSFS